MAHAYEDDELIDLNEAGKLLGGIHRDTYRRGARQGRFPPVLHPSPGAARVSKRKVLETRERIIAEGDT